MKDKIYLKKTLSEMEREDQRKLRCVLLILVVLLLVIMLTSCEATEGRGEPAMQALALCGTGLLVMTLLAFAMRKCAAKATTLAVESPLMRVSAAVLALEDLHAILSASTVQLCLACENVRKAQRDLAVEDYGAKFGAAQDCLVQVIKCHTNLLHQIGAAQQKGDS